MVGTKRKFDEISSEGVSLIDVPAHVIAAGILPWLTQKEAVLFTGLCRHFQVSRDLATHEDMPMGIRSTHDKVMEMDFDVHIPKRDNLKIVEIESMTAAYLLIDVDLPTVKVNGRHNFILTVLSAFPNIRKLKVTVGEWVDHHPYFCKLPLRELFIGGHTCNTAQDRIGGRTVIDLSKLPKTLEKLTLCDYLSFEMKRVGEKNPGLVVTLLPPTCQERGHLPAHFAYSIDLEGETPSFVCDAKYYALMRWTDVTMPWLCLSEPGSVWAEEVEAGIKKNSTIEQLTLRDMSENAGAVEAWDPFLAAESGRALRRTASHGVKVKMFYVKLQPWDWFPFCYALVTTITQYPGSFEAVLVTPIQKGKSLELPPAIVPVGTIELNICVSVLLGPFPSVAFAHAPDVGVVYAINTSGELEPPPDKMIAVRFVWPGFD